ncbi:MAG: hypothetical protein ACI8W8_004728 [Rhodothermales bacterium]|jgi:hypothetical protein
MNNSIITRRQLLERASIGFGATALGALMAQDSYAGLSMPVRHHVAKAKNVIFAYMSGGVSHVDSFDPKPLLAERAGKALPMKIERTVFNNNGKIMPAQWEFKNRGKCGMPVSELFPHMGGVADELALVRSMTAKFSEHGQANFYMHSGFPFMGYPSAGAWTSYGLGSEADDMPGYVVLQSGKAAYPHGGVALYSNGFLSARHQASVLKIDSAAAVPNIKPSEDLYKQRHRLDMIRKMDQQFSQDSRIDAAIANYETAYQMQTAVPEVVDLDKETAATKKLYGMDSSNEHTAAFARQCLMARRLVEKGVRFVELSCMACGGGGGGAANPWDQHSGLKSGHGKMAAQVDQPIAGLIRDLKSRGMLDETIVLWSGEFGRTPFSQGSNGRDHNPFGFSVWMAGGGFKGGSIYGATDEFGYHAVENKATIFDMWATILHQLGMNHERMTYRFGGRDLRLTDVHGNVLHDILA